MGKDELLQLINNEKNHNLKLFHIKCYIDKYKYIIEYNINYYIYLKTDYFEKDEIICIHFKNDTLMREFIENKVSFKHILLNNRTTTDIYDDSDFIDVMENEVLGKFEHYFKISNKDYLSLLEKI